MKQIENFKSFTEKNSDEQNLLRESFLFSSELLNEKSNLAYKTIAIALQLKVNAIKNSIRSQTDVSRKIDLLAQQNSYVASLTLLDIATSTNDRSLLGKSRKK